MSQEPGTESNRGHKHARHTSENHGTSCTYTELKAVEEVLKMSFTRHGCEASVFVRVCESVCLCVCGFGWTLRGQKVWNCWRTGKPIYQSGPVWNSVFSPDISKRFNIIYAPQVTHLCPLHQHSACQTNAITFQSLTYENFCYFLLWIAISPPTNSAFTVWTV